MTMMTMWMVMAVMVAAAAAAAAADKSSFAYFCGLLYMCFLKQICVHVQEVCLHGLPLFNAVWLSQGRERWRTSTEGQAFSSANGSTFCRCQKLLLLTSSCRNGQFLVALS
jgi:hypothetical protein